MKITTTLLSLAFAFLILGFTPAEAALCGTSTNNSNTCEGSFAGSSLASGTRNSFLGRSSGQNLVSGNLNSYFGSHTGFAAVNSSRNSFFGANSGNATTSSSNAFFGAQSGSNNGSGGFNSFFGDFTGFSNTTGSYISLFGRGTDVGAPDLRFATAVGAGATVLADNTIQLGRDGFDVVRIGSLGSGGSTQLCLNGNNEISSCSGNALVSNDSNLEKLQETINDQNNEIRILRGQIESIKNSVCSTNGKLAICR